MLAFLDTEFSNPFTPRLISIGMVAEDGRHIYREIQPLPTNCSDFVRSEVLPHLCGAADVMAGRTEAGRPVAEWIRSLGNDVVIAADFRGDFKLLTRPLSGARRSPRFCQLHLNRPSFEHAPRPDEELLTQTFEDSLSAYHERTKTPRHHALHDAMAWKEAWTTLRRHGWHRQLPLMLVTGDGRTVTGKSSIARVLKL